MEHPRLSGLEAKLQNEMPFRICRHLLPSTGVRECYHRHVLDNFLPTYDFSEAHHTVVAAPRDVVRRAADEWQPAESILWRALLRLRGLGAPSGTLRQWAEANGFLCLADAEDEVVYAQAGRFWSLNERAALVSPRTTEELLALDDPRAAVAAMSLRFEPLAPDRTRLTTETRIRALGPAARRRFRLYWLLIRPFSGLLRRAMLKGIEKRALALAAR